MSEYDPAPAPRERREDEDAAFDRWRAENPGEWDAMLNRTKKPEGPT